MKIRKNKLRWGAVAVVCGVVLSSNVMVWAQPAKAETKVTPQQQKHLDEAVALNNQAVALHGEGRYDAAIPLTEKALALTERVYGKEHPDVATFLNNLAVLYESKGDYARAAPLLERALAIKEKVFGKEHPSLATSLNNLAGLYEAMGKESLAISMQERSQEIRETILLSLLSTGSESQKRALLDTLTGETHASVSLHTRTYPSNPQARNLAFTTILRRKGRLLEAVMNEMATLRGSLEQKDQQLLDTLRSVRSELSTRTLQGPGNHPIDEHQKKLAELSQQADALERDISTRSASFAVQRQRATWQSVQSALPPSSVLVEMAVYEPFDAKANKASEKWQESRYVAYTLSNHGEPGWVDLGESKEIDELVSSYRTALQRKADLSSVNELSKKIYSRIIQPVMPLIGSSKHLILSPDGALNLLPFASLMDSTGKYFIEKYLLTQVTSGRDVIRWKIHESPKSGDLLLASPAYDNSTGSVASPTRSSSRSGAMGNMVFSPLPGVEQEVRELSRLLPGSVVKTGNEASETALLEVQSPRIVHIATHGFFLQNAPEVKKPFHRGFAKTNQLGPVPENPLLRSGLALAGANVSATKTPDGILTAMETAGLSWIGTKLVVLSACETGVGEVKNGDSVYGLKRALVLAGAETQVTSLWKVDDDATKTLMAKYYQGVLAGQGRSESLRNVQLNMQDSPDTAHPYFWASFSVTGDPSSITGQLPNLDALRVHDRPGCGCEVVGEQSDWGGWWLALVCGLAAKRTRLWKNWLQIIMIVFGLSFLTSSASAQTPTDCGWTMSAMLGNTDQWIETVEREFGPTYPLYLTTLETTAMVGLKRCNAVDRAEKYLIRAIAVRKQYHREDQHGLAEAFIQLGLVYSVKEKLRESKYCIEEAEKALQNSSQNHADLTLTLVGFKAEIQRRLGEYEQSELLFEDYCDQVKRKSGERSTEYANALLQLGGVLMDRGQFSKARILAEKALSIEESQGQPQHTNIAYTRHALGTICLALGDFSCAESNIQRALEWREKEGAPLDVIASRSSLGELYRQQGDLVRSIQTLEAAVEKSETDFPEGHPFHWIVLNNLALAYLARGEPERAAKIMIGARDSVLRTVGDKHQDYARATINLATMSIQLGYYKEASKYLREAIQNLVNTVGPEHPNVANAYVILALAELQSGNSSEARELLVRALRLKTKVYGETSGEVAKLLSDLGVLDLMDEKWTSAEQRLLRALELQRAQLGKTHPAVATTLHYLAWVSLRLNKTDRAIDYCTARDTIVQTNLEQLGGAGAEEEKRAYIKTLTHLLHGSINMSLGLAQADSRVVTQAAEMVLRLKGRSLDLAKEASIALSLSSNPEERFLLNRLALARSALATRVLRGPEPGQQAIYEKEIERLVSERKKIESEIATKRPNIRGVNSVSISAVRNAIPSGMALIEYIRYEPLFKASESGSKASAARYIAYVIRRDGEIAYADVGEATHIDKLAQTMRESLRTPNVQPAVESSAQLYQALISPLKPYLRGDEGLIISPDGPLGLIPFGALVDENGRYLIETTLTTYVSTGRDLLGYAKTALSHTAPVILGAPNFGELSTSANARRTGSLAFGSLPGLEKEARAIASVLPNASLVLSAQASERYVKQLHGPWILHIATHGFYGMGEGHRSETRGIALPARAETANVDPALSAMARSGLALASANVGGAEGEDGILTAMEMASLDLNGTALVMLSACETGVGAAAHGEGVFGIRRALVMAGAETQVLTLWKVDDSATAELAESYYRALSQGAGRADAMRQSQLALMKNPETRSPYYWAAFVVSGQPSNLQGKYADPSAWRAPRRISCACEVTSSPSTPSPITAWIVGVVIVVLRRSSVKYRGGNLVSLFVRYQRFLGQPQKPQKAIQRFQTTTKTQPFIKAGPDA